MFVAAGAGVGILGAGSGAPRLGTIPRCTSCDRVGRTSGFGICHSGATAAVSSIVCEVIGSQTRGGVNEEATATTLAATVATPAVRRARNETVMTIPLTRRPLRTT